MGNPKIIIITKYNLKRNLLEPRHFRKWRRNTKKIQKR